MIGRVQLFTCKLYTVYVKFHNEAVCCGSAPEVQLQVRQGAAYIKHGYHICQSDHMEFHGHITFQLKANKLNYWKDLLIPLKKLNTCSINKLQ